MRFNKKYIWGMFLLTLLLVTFSTTTLIKSTADNNSLDENDISTSQPDDPFEQNDDFFSKAITLRNMSSIIKNMGNNTEALKKATEALQIFDQMGKLSDKADMFMIIGMIQLSFGMLMPLIRVMKNHSILTISYLIFMVKLLV